MGEVSSAAGDADAAAGGPGDAPGAEEAAAEAVDGSRYVEGEHSGGSAAADSTVPLDQGLGHLQEADSLAAAAAGQGEGAANGHAPPPSAAGGDPGSGAKQYVYESRVLTSDEDLATAGAKIVDFGNACWTYKHFTDDIQVSTV
jgi:hypothetical protein